jgi:hypothetical protein
MEFQEAFEQIQGLKLIQELSEKQRIVSKGGAESGAVLSFELAQPPSELAEIIGGW